MPTITWPGIRCAVCGLKQPASANWFTANISCNWIMLSYADDETHEKASAGIHLCSEEHAGQFLTALLSYKGSADENAFDEIGVLPITDQFRLVSSEPGVELSLAMAIEAFWQENVRELDYWSHPNRIGSMQSC